jgi:hypothetical protein
VLSDHSFKRHNLRIFEWFLTVKIDLKGRKRKFRGLYPVQNRSLLSLYQVNTDKCTINYRYAPHNDDSVNDGPHIQKKLLALCSNRLVQRKECVSQYHLSCSYPRTRVTISDKHRHMHSLLNGHFNNTIRNYNMFQPLKGHLQRV